MSKPSLLIWMVFILLLILPTPAGKILFDLASGIFLITLIVPIVLVSIGWLSWKRIQSKLQTCEACGSSFLSNQIICPICGGGIKNTNDSFENIPASSATIDIKPEKID